MHPPSKFKLTLARYLSNGSNPVFLLFGAILIVSWRYGDNLTEIVRASLIAFAIIAGAAFIWVCLMWYRYRKIDLDISERSDRIIPLFLVTLGSIIANQIIEARLDPAIFHSLIFLSRLLIAILLTITVITIYWKISVHMVTLAALITLLGLARDQIWFLLYILLFPVAWARLSLKQHTLKQIVGGTAIGIGLTFVFYVLLRSA